MSHLYSVQELEEKVKRDILDKVMTKMALEVTKATKEYVRKHWYIAKRKSGYYDRREEEGGFLGTFEDNSNYVDSLFFTTQRRGEKVYIRLLLRDYSSLEYEDPQNNDGKFHWGRQFGSHTSFEGKELINNNYRSELDDLIDEGYRIKTLMGTTKYIRGINFREFASNYFKEHKEEMLNKYLTELGYETVGYMGGLGRKRMSFDITKIDIQVLEEN